MTSSRLGRYREPGKLLPQPVVTARPMPRCVVQELETLGPLMMFTGKPLCPQAVAAARREEMDFVRNVPVYQEVPEETNIKPVAVLLVVARNISFARPKQSERLIDQQGLLRRMVS